LGLAYVFIYCLGGIPARGHACKAKDAAMLRQVHEGDEVKARVENVNGTMTIVLLVKQILISD